MCLSLRTLFAAKFRKAIVTNRAPPRSPTLILHLTQMQRVSSMTDTEIYRAFSHLNTHPARWRVFRQPYAKPLELKSEVKGGGARDHTGNDRTAVHVTTKSNSKYHRRIFATLAYRIRHLESAQRLCSHDAIAAIRTGDVIVLTT
jgi:hypothetical protein